MGTYTGQVGGCGLTLRNKPTYIGIQLPENEYPIKITFELKSGGAYWKNSAYVQTTGEFYLYSDENGSNPVKFGELTLPKISSNVTNKEFEVSGAALQGAALYFTSVTSNVSGVGLRNVCKITVETTVGTPEEPMDPDLYKKLLPTIDQDDKMVGRSRRADWTVKVNGVNCTDEIKKDLLSLEITDNEESAADDLQIKMADTHGQWLQNWLNETVHKGSRANGLSYEVWIGLRDDTGKVIQQKTGTFTLDSMSHDGPPSVCKIKCASVELQGGIRNDENDKSWENYDLRGIAQEISNKGKLKLLYCSTTNPKFDRAEQDSETDIAFLIRMCDKYSLSMKITDGKLVVFDRKQFENEEAILDITFGDGQYTKWSCNTGSGSVTYDICTVKYTDPKTGNVIEGEYKTDEWQEEEDRVAEANEDKSEDEKETPDHTELKIRNVKVSSKEEADALAESELNLANLYERTVTINIPGNPAMMAGLPINLKKFGYWSGKYMISTCTHSISTSGYTTKLKLRFIKGA